MQPTTDKGNGSTAALERSRSKAKNGRGVMGSLTSHEVDVHDGYVLGRLVRLVREERYNVPVPHALKGEVHRLFAKRNIAYELDQRGEIVDTRLLGRVLVIVLHKDAKIARGIVGLPGTAADEKRQRKLGFTHLTIGYVPKGCRDDTAGPRPEGYDERAFALRFYKPKGGGRHGDEKGGEEVHAVIDELSVLEWIHENGLTALYEAKPLVVNGLLPKTDEQRAEENALAAKMQIAFGRSTVEPHPERDFHRSRLLTRYRNLFRANVEAWDEGGIAKAETRAYEAYRKRVIAEKAAHELASGQIAAQEFFLDDQRSFAYALFNLPGARYIVAVDLEHRFLLIRPLVEDVNGLEQIEVAGRLLTLAGCVSIDWQTFAMFSRGIGAALWQSTFEIDETLN